MPASTQRQRSGRKGHYSCEFCRIRKLRCDRPLPCTSCRSRGKTCHFESAPTTSQTSRDCARSTPPSTTAATALAAALQSPQGYREDVHLTPSPFPQPSSTPTGLQLPHPAPPPPNADLLAQIQALARLTQQLEKRVVESTTSHQRYEGEATLQSPSLSAANHGGLTSQSDLEQVSDVVAHLQRVSMSKSAFGPIQADDLVFKVERIRDIPHAPTYISQLGNPTPCVWLPHHAEAKILVNRYIEDISYIQHVVHHPSLPATIDDTYRQVKGHEPVKPGNLVLLLSIIACSTHVWTPHDGVDNVHSPFLSSAQANAQTPLWIKAAYAVLNAAQDGATPTLETIQGIIILSFVISNLEGVSLRYRSLMSTALLLGRELNLHRIDQGSDGTPTSPLHAEMSRRVWWYLVATDWLLAARYGGPNEGVYQTHPLHMTVNKPRNINDVDLVDNEDLRELPASMPTEMSYFLQRVRLAEISRTIVDHNLMSMTSLGQPSYYAHIMAMDFELDQLINNMPAFFQLCTYERTSDSNNASVFIQAYLLNSLMHSQRCKLHITYLTSEPSTNPAHAASRDTCLQSARRIIRAERQLLRSQHPFIRVRLRLAAILYSVFMASIVLLMDVCVNRPASLQEEINDGDVAEALRIIEDAGTYSLAAAKLLESLTQILAKHRVQRQHSVPPALSTMQLDGAPSIGSLPRMATSVAHTHQSHDPSAFPANVSLVDDNYLSRGSGSGPFTEQGPATRNIPRPSLENNVYLDSVEWNELFSDVVSSSFF